MLTDNEIRLKIAELKGYKDNGVMNDGAHEFYLPEGVFGQYFYIDGRVCDPKLPDWPADISAAWGLVEEMPYFRLARLFRLSPQGFQCQSADCGTWGDHVIDGENKDGTPYHCGCIYADADTAARAICLAYLQFIESRGKI